MSVGDSLEIIGVFMGIAGRKPPLQAVQLRSDGGLFGFEVYAGDSAGLHVVGLELEILIEESSFGLGAIEF